MTGSGAFSEIGRTSDSVIDAVQNSVLYEQRVVISAQLGDPRVHLIAIRSVERALSLSARQQPARIDIEHVAMDVFAP